MKIKYWWQREPILNGPGMQEPMTFRLRRGGGPEDIEEQYARFFTEENAEKIAAAGYTFVETAFFKGLGLEYERSEWERSKRFLGWLKKRGVRVGVYTQWGSFFTETFFQEVPEARKWVQIGVDGRPIEYFDPPNQYFRWRGCPGNRDFLAFLKRAIDIAIKEIGVDVVYFDNLCLFEGHDTLCYCDCCRQGFRDYLARKFPTPESLYRRMGLRSVVDIEPPRFRPWTDYTLVAMPIADPLIQEFIEFRCEQLAEAWWEIWEYVRSLNPEAAIMGNPSFPRKYNERLTSAIDFWRLKRVPALHYMENAVRDVGIREGVVVSNIRGYKYGRVLGQVFVCCGGEQVPALSYCECLAFQHGSGGSLSPAAAPYRVFYEQYRQDFYEELEELHEVAVLRHDPSLTWRWHESFTVMELAQHMLLSAGIPWMPLWGQQLLDGTLKKYRVLVVPGCACLSRAEVAQMIEFVAGGGGLVILENAGCYDEYHHTIRQWRFAPLFEAVADPAGFAISYSERGRRPSFAHQRAPLFATFGKGRCAYLPLIRRSRKPVRTYEEIGGYNGFQHLQLPRNWRRLPKAIEKVAALPLLVKVEGPTTLMSEFYRKGQQLLVHLVNYAERCVPAGCEVRVAGGAKKKASLYTPTGKSVRRELQAVRSSGRCGVFRLPAFERYSLLVV